MRHDVSLLKAIRYFGSQQALGKVIKASQQQVQYWLNSGNRIPYEYVLKIEAVTHGYVTRYELAPSQADVNHLIDKLIEEAASELVKGITRGKSTEVLGNKGNPTDKSE